MSTTTESTSKYTERRGRSSTAQTVERALDALELLAAHGRFMGVSEVARELRVSSPSAHRLLSTLAARGYARQDPVTARYAIGLRSFSLATLAMADLDLRAAAAPHLRTLNEVTGETVHLALYADGETVYIDRMEGSRPVGPISRIGARAPAHCVSTGRAILAFMPDQEIERLLARGLQRYTEHSPATRESLEADRQRTRRQGYAINEGSWRPEISGVAAPIRDYSGQVVASLGVCLPTERFAPDSRGELIRHTLAAAAAASAELGFSPLQAHAV